LPGDHNSARTLLNEREISKGERESVYFDKHINKSINTSGMWGEEIRKVPSTCAIIMRVGIEISR